MPGASLQTAPGVSTKASSIPCPLNTPRETAEGRGWGRPGKEQREAQRELEKEGQKVQSVQTRGG